MRGGWLTAISAVQIALCMCSDGATMADPTKEAKPLEAAELRAVQAPLKDRYRAEPAAAQITLTAEGRLGDGSVSCSVR